MQGKKVILEKCGKYFEEEGGEYQVIKAFENFSKKFEKYKVSLEGMNKIISFPYISEGIVSGPEAFFNYSFNEFSIISNLFPNLNGYVHRIIIVADKNKSDNVEKLVQEINLIPRGFSYERTDENSN